MKIQKLIIKNIGLIEDLDLTLDKPLILFYGECRQGKTTILNAIRYAFGGAFPADLIRRGCLEAIVKLETDQGTVTREFYRADDGTNKARPLTVVNPAGARVAKPVEWLKQFLNPFLLDGDHLVNMLENERKKYFVQLFGTDMTALDKERAECEAKARELRATIRGYGDLDLTPVARVNVDDLRKQLTGIAEKNRQEEADAAIFNAGIDEHNRAVDNRERERTATMAEREIARKTFEDLTTRLQTQDAWIRDNPKKTERATPELLDSSKLADAISEAGAQNVRADIFESNQQKAAARKEQETQVLNLEQRQRDIAAEKFAKLKALSDACGIPGLRFDVADHDFTYEDTTPGMLSTSQLMRLSSALSALYPDSLSLELIDRAESLGRSIFDFVDRAKRDNKTILATIVGEKPAEAPDNVGVFVVEGGKVS